MAHGLHLASEETGSHPQQLRESTVCSSHSGGGSVPGALLSALFSLFSAAAGVASPGVLAPAFLLCFLSLLLLIAGGRGPTEGAGLQAET